MPTVKMGSNTFGKLKAGANRIDRIFAGNEMVYTHTQAYNVQPAPDLDIKFDPRTGNTGRWLGADSARSIPFNDGTGRVLWLFADTYWRDSATGIPVDRNGSVMTNDSLAIQSGPDLSTSTVTFYKATSPSLRWFPISDTHYSWPMDGVFIGNDLYVLSMRVQSNNPLGGEWGWCVHRVPNAKTTNITTWVSTLLYASGDTGFRPVFSPSIEGGYIHIFAINRFSGWVLCRWSTANFTGIGTQANIEYYNGFGGWSTDPIQGFVISENPDTSEGSVHKRSDGRYVIVDCVGSFPFMRGGVRVSAKDGNGNFVVAPGGGYRPPPPTFQIGDHVKDDPGYDAVIRSINPNGTLRIQYTPFWGGGFADKTVAQCTLKAYSEREAYENTAHFKKPVASGLATYAYKAHPGLAGTGLVVSCVDNANNVPNLGIYWPKFHRILPPTINNLKINASGLVTFTVTGLPDLLYIRANAGAWVEIDTQLTSYQMTAGQTIELKAVGVGGEATATAALTASAVPVTLRGVNSAGGEFAHEPLSLPGVYSTDYSYDSRASLDYYYSRGHKVVRMPFRWERVQNVLGGALSEPGITELSDAIDRASAAGLYVIPDLHNYGRFVKTDDTEVMFGAGLTDANFADVWTKLQQRFAGKTSIVGWGLMNEPHDLPPAPVGAFTGTTRYDWATSIQGWTGGGGTVTASSTSGKLRLVATASSSGFLAIRRDDAGQKLGGTLTGRSLSIQVTLAAGTAGVWRAMPQYQNSSYQWVTAPNITHTRADTGATVSQLIPGVAVNVVATYDSDFTSNAFAVQIDSNDAVSGTSYTVDIDNFAQGSLGAAGLTPWKSASQAAVTAIRGTGDTRIIYIAGDSWSGAKEWALKNGNPWITDPANKTVYEAHYYFDPANNGVYAESYDVVNTDAVNRGYANLSARVIDELNDFTEWLATHNQKGLIGEIGWPATAQWNAVGQSAYTVLNDAGVSVTYWAAGERWGSNYNIGLYTYGPLGAKLQAGVVEATVNRTV